MSNTFTELLNSNDQLLIISGKDFDSITSSISILLKRFYLNKITHVSFQDTILNDAIFDLLDYYDNIVVVGLSKHVRHSSLQEVFRRKNIIFISQKPTSKYMSKTLDDIELLELGLCYWNLYEESSDKVNSRFFKLKNTLSIPGIFWKDLSIAFKHSLWPYIPSITGCDIKLQEFDFRKLIKELLKKIVKYGFSPEYLDYLIKGLILVDENEGIDVLDIVLLTEAQFSMDRYLISIMKYLLTPSLIKQKDVVDLVNEYVRKIKDLVDTIVQTCSQKTIVELSEVDLVSLKRICSILRFHKLFHRNKPIIYTYDKEFVYILKFYDSINLSKILMELEKNVPEFYIQELYSKYIFIQTLDKYLDRVLSILM